MHDEKSKLIAREDIDYSSLTTWQGDDVIGPLLKRGEKNNEVYRLRHGEGPFRLSEVNTQGCGVLVAKLIPLEGDNTFTAALWRLKKVK